MLFIKELNPELNTQKDYSGQTLYATLRANTLLFVSPWNSFTYFTHYWLDNDVKRMSKRSRIFKPLTKVVYNF